MSSMSKGCFVYKNSRSKKPIPTTAKVAHMENADRIALFDKDWKDVEKEIKDLRSQSHGQVIDELLKFVKESTKEMDQWRSNQIIPTATLIAGANLPDHDAVFALLQAEIGNGITPHLVLLTSKDAANIKILITRLISSLLSVQVEDHDDETEEDGEGVDASSVKRNRLTMPVLASWYSHLDHAGSKKKHSSGDVLTPIKRHKISEDCFKTSASNSPQNKYMQDPSDIDVTRGSHSDQLRSPPIVLVLRDLEAFPPHVLQRFVLILSDYFDRLPLILIFGVSSSAFTIHEILTLSTASKLAIETFTTGNPTFYLDAMLRKILICSKFHFKLSLKVFQLFEEVFLLNDLSVQTFVSSYKFCMMDHYYERPLSVLCCNWQLMNKRINDLNAESIECVRRLGSFRNYVEDQPLKMQRALLLDDSHLKENLSNLIHEFHRYHHDFFPILYCIHAITSELPGFPLGKHLRETYFACLDRDIVDTKEFEQCMKLLNLMAKDELVERLIIGCKAIQKCILPSLVVSAVRRSLEDIVKRILALGSNNVVDENGKSSSAIGTNEVSVIVGELQENGLQKKRLYRYELQERLRLDMAAESKRKRDNNSSATLNVYSSLREETVNIIRRAAKKFLVCPKRLPLHEIFYYDSFSSVQPQLIGGSRSALQTALADPQSYLKCNCCSLDDDDDGDKRILKTFPDICITFKLHLESGRLINIYDWLQAFILISELECEPSDSPKDASTSFKDRKPSAKLMARFIQSVAELQFLGFVKGTNRKTDHVARLIW